MESSYDVRLAHTDCHYGRRLKFMQTHITEGGALSTMESVCRVENKAAIYLLKQKQNERWHGVAFILLAGVECDASNNANVENFDSVAKEWNYNHNNN